MLLKNPLSRNLILSLYVIIQCIKSDPHHKISKQFRIFETNFQNISLGCHSVYFPFHLDEEKTVLNLTINNFILTYCHDHVGLLNFIVLNMQELIRNEDKNLSRKLLEVNSIKKIPHRFSFINLSLRKEIKKKTQQSTGKISSLAKIVNFLFHFLLIFPQIYEMCFSEKYIKGKFNLNLERFFLLKFIVYFTVRKVGKKYLM